MIRKNYLILIMKSKTISSKYWATTYSDSFLEFSGFEKSSF